MGCASLPAPKILVVDDQEQMRWTLRNIIERAGMRVVEAEDGSNALDIIQHHSPHVLLLDMRMPGMSGFEVLRRAKSLDGDLPVIIVTGHGDIEDAVRTLKAGAFDYVTKPFTNQHLVDSILSALDFRHLQDAAGEEDLVLDTASSLRERMGQSQVILALEKEVGKVAPTDFAVLIEGETGTGKEIVAQAIRMRSQRSEKPFVAVDCGAIPETLIESELFGHEKGAFTGADRRKRGRIEEADKGTLFLDEISSLPLAMQSKLLRVLQEKHFYRLGGNVALRADVRIIAATNRDLLEPRSNFRSDLYYRLAEYVVRVPHLRERREDILFLANRFMKLTNRQLGKNVRAISDDAIACLMAYDWPGNVRELRNAIRRAVLLGKAEVEQRHLAHLEGPGPSLPCAPEPIDPMAMESTGELLQSPMFSLKEIVRRNTASVERTVLRQVLERTGGNKAEAARLLQVDYKTLHTKVKKYGISARKASDGNDQEGESSGRDRQDLPP